MKQQQWTLVSSYFLDVQVFPSVRTSSFIVLLWLFLSLPLLCAVVKPWVHKFSKNLEVTSKFLSARWVTLSKRHSEDPQTLGTTVQNLVTWVT